jgi:7-keto-8-aminopelargonate synthetase-like enzyme
MPGTVIFSDDPSHMEELPREYPRSTPKVIAFESVYCMDGHISPRSATSPTNMAR